MMFPPNVHQRLIVKFSFAAMLLACCTADAQFPTIAVTGYSRFAGKPGSEFEMRTSAGSSIEEVTELRFSCPDISAELLTANPLPFTTDRIPRHGTFSVKIPDSVAPGRYEVRSVGRHGISNPRVFIVHRLATELVAAPSTDANKPTALTIGCVQHAKATAANSHKYSIALKAGQAIRVDCLAAKLDSRMIPRMTLKKAGRTVASHRGSDTFDPSITVRSEETSEYELIVHDTMYRGGADYGYLLAVQPLDSAIDLCCPDAAAEPGQLAGSLHVAAPSDMDQAITDATPTEETSDPKKITIPSTIAATFNRVDDEDIYEFKATEGDALSLQLFSQRFGQPTDARMILYRSESQTGGDPKWVQVFVQDDAKSIGDGSVKLATTDPQTNIVIPKTSTYRLHVHDLDNGTALGETQDYVLRIRPAAPSFDLLAYHPFPSKDANAARQHGAVLFQNGTISLRVFCLRNDGWNGAVSVQAKGLPDGVTCEPATIAANQSSVNLTLVASPKATRAVASIELTGTAEINGQKISEPARVATVQYGRGAGREYIRSRLCHRLWIAVSDVDQAPIGITIGDGKTVQATKGQEIKLPIKLTRTDLAKSDCVVRSKNLPPNITAGDVTIKGDKADGTVVLKVAGNATAGIYSIFMQAETKIKWKANPQALVRAQAYRDHLQKLHDDPTQSKQKPEIAAAIKVADQRVNAAKGAANPIDLTIYPSSNHVTIHVVDPS